MQEELTRLPGGRLRTHNGEILPSARESEVHFRRCQTAVGHDGTLTYGVYVAIGRMFDGAQVDEWGHWTNPALYVNPRNGYAHVWVPQPTQRNLGAHVVAYMVFREPIVMGNAIDHVCRHKLCWNPRHLDQKTIGENTRAGVLARRHQVQPPLFYNDGITEP